MPELSIKQKLKIANEGGEFQENSNSWIGTKIKKGKRLGIVIQDFNGMNRRLVVKFKDGKQEDIVMNNIGEDLGYIHKYEWYEPRSKLWYRF